MDSRETLLYWIAQRERVRVLKENSIPRPWSHDPVFQTTYFCNVRREDDKVTKWVRNFYTPHVGHDMFEYNIILSRFLNWPKTLEAVGFQIMHSPAVLLNKLEMLASYGKIWGNAYVITTHGIPMPKATYLCHNVLESVDNGLEAITQATRYGSGGPTLGAAYLVLQRFEGIGTFLAGQILADLKNTMGHPLYEASDRMTFVAPGPGSIRGVNWFHRNVPDHSGRQGWMWDFMEIRDYVDEHWNEGTMGPPICNQDLQNCLCEYDKYMRVSKGTGRSKRSYNGRQ